MRDAAAKLVDFPNQPAAGGKANMDAGDVNRTGITLLPPRDEFTFDDNSNARLFANRYRSALRWQSDAGKWLAWNKTHWQADDTGLVMEIAKLFAKSLYDMVPDLAHSRAELATAMRHATRSNNSAFLIAFVELS